MAYPKPLPELTQEEAIRLLADVQRFTLTPKQKALYKDSKVDDAKDVYLED